MKLTMSITTKPNVAATFTIKRAADMTPKGRRDIAEWLRRQADNLVSDGELYSDRFTARYIYK